MFWSITNTHTSAQQRSAVITALDGFVAFATLESYGVVDGRDDQLCDLALERRLRARRRAAARQSCSEGVINRDEVRRGRSVERLTGQR